MMATNLTGSKIKDTFAQLLHVDGGPEATEKAVLSAVGVPTALKVGTGSASVDNIRFDGNTVSTLDTDGDLTLSPNGTGSVVITKVTYGDQAQARAAMGLGSAALAATGDFATAAQGGLADTAVQPGDIGTLAAQDADNVNITGGSIQDVSFTGSFVGITSITSLSFKATNDLGFTTGAGGTVTQLTSKSTPVTLNKPSGQITMDAAELPRNSGATFTLTNSFIAATDVVIVSIASGATPSAYTATVDAVATGSCAIHLHNHQTGTDLSEAVVLNFVVIKGVNS
jgi:hypothetical protein